MACEHICEKAFALSEETGFVVIPTRCKAPLVSGWQGLEKTYDGHKWGDATGFGIQTGWRSGVTVIDVDLPSREWFDKFWAQSGLQPTTTVETPSGGLHLYYKYDARLKQTQGFGKIDIDIRNDGGQVVGPGSPYDTKKKDKMKFNGKPYKLTVGFDQMRELDPIWLEFQEHGIDQETFKPLAPKCVFDEPKPKRKPKKRAPVVAKTEGAGGRFMELMMVYAKECGCGYKAWREGVWSWTAFCDEMGLDALEWADKWSQQIEGYDGKKSVEDKIREYREKATNEYGEGFIINKIPGKMRGTAGSAYRRLQPVKCVFFDDIRTMY